MLHDDQRNQFAAHLLALGLQWGTATKPVHYCHSAAAPMVKRPWNAEHPLYSRFRMPRWFIFDKLKFWLNQDWSKADVDIAEITGDPISSVSIWRRRLKAIPTSHIGSRRRERKQLNIERWNAWDWNQQNAVLARQYGLSKERVRAIRALLRKPPSPKKWKRARQQTFSTPEKLKARSTSRVTIKFWPLVNWRLRNIHIAEIWGAKYNTIKQIRCRKHHGPADRIDPARYREELEREKARADCFLKRDPQITPT